MSNSPSKGVALMAYTRFALHRSTPSLWRVTFDNPPINLIDPVIVVELDALLTEIEQDERLAVVVFDSADRDYFLAHFDITADRTPYDALRAAMILAAVAALALPFTAISAVIDVLSYRSGLIAARAPGDRDRADSPRARFAGRARDRC